MENASTPLTFYFSDNIPEGQKMISNNDIKEIAGAVTYERGRQLYENGYVLDLDAECVDGKIL